MMPYMLVNFIMLDVLIFSIVIVIPAEMEVLEISLMICRNIWKLIILGRRLRTVFKFSILTHVSGICV